jgi:hypothetical protein
MGFSMRQIAVLLGLWGNSVHASLQVRGLVQPHVDCLDEKICEMSAIKRTLEKLIPLVRTTAEQTVRSSRDSPSIVDTRQIQTRFEPCTRLGGWHSARAARQRLGLRRSRRAMSI